MPTIISANPSAHRQVVARAKAVLRRSCEETLPRTLEIGLFSRRELVDMVQLYEFEGYSRTIDTHIKNLHQKKIAEHLPDKDVIHSVYGTGYLLSLDADLLSVPEPIKDTVRCPNVLLIPG